MPGPLSRGDHGIAPDGFAKLAIKDLVHVATLSGNLTLDDTYPSLLKLDPGGLARDVTLPAEATNEGVFVWIVNAADAAENLVVKDDSPATIATINQNEEGIFFCDGTSWILFRVATIALS